MILDPLKPQKDGRKVFQFNRVFGPRATQGKTITKIKSVSVNWLCCLVLGFDSLYMTLVSDDVFNDTQPLIRSVMDGYNACIFAYGQTGSGKTYTMVRPLICFTYKKWQNLVLYLI